MNQSSINIHSFHLILPHFLPLKIIRLKKYWVGHLPPSSYTYAYRYIFEHLCLNLVILQIKPSKQNRKYHGATILVHFNKLMKYKYHKIFIVTFYRNFIILLTHWFRRYKRRHPHEVNFISVRFEYNTGFLQQNLSKTSEYQENVITLHIDKTINC